jgi:hypothetical protein
MSRLVKDGYVKQIWHRGFFVNEITVEEIERLYGAKEGVGVVSRKKRRTESLRDRCGTGPSGCRLATVDRTRRDDRRSHVRRSKQLAMLRLQEQADYLKSRRILG